MMESVFKTLRAKLLKHCYIDKADSVREYLTAVTPAFLAIAAIGDLDIDYCLNKKKKKKEERENSSRNTIMKTNGSPTQSPDALRPGVLRGNDLIRHRKSLLRNSPMINTLTELKTRSDFKRLRGNATIFVNVRETIKQTPALGFRSALPRGRRRAVHPNRACRCPASVPLSPFPFVVFGCLIAYHLLSLV